MTLYIPRIKLAIIMSLICITLAGGGCASSRSFDGSLKSIVKPFRFSTVKWEAGVIRDEIARWLSHKTEDTASDVQTVNNYFFVVDRIKALKSSIESADTGTKKDNITSLRAELDQREKERASLERPVASIIASQIQGTLAQQGIFNPVIGWRRHFPPLNFRLEKLPHLLIVSPRERIESMREITLIQDIIPEQMAEIESQVDRLGVSSLVVELGGYGGTYPTIVLNEAEIRFTIDTAVEEWMHQYLAFTPLGFRYLLDVTGIARDYEIATINETVASMVSGEIGQLVCRQYYPQCQGNAQAEEAGGTKFDFNREMREIRKAVDLYLAQGQIEPAEQFMEAKRQYLAAQGYYIRKLNQAYFAFNGTYADRPTSISPIGAELRALRDRSASLKEFIDQVSSITSRQDLKALTK